MGIFLSPELNKEEAQVLNIVDHKEQGCGYLAYIINDKKIYVYGQLENEGVCEDFKELVKPYLKGIEKLKEGAEVLTYISVGGKKLDLANEEKN